MVVSNGWYMLCTFIKSLVKWFFKTLNFFYLSSADSRICLFLFWWYHFLGRFLRRTFVCFSFCFWLLIFRWIGIGWRRFDRFLFSDLNNTKMKLIKCLCPISLWWEEQLGEYRHGCWKSYKDILRNCPLDHYDLSNMGTFQEGVMVCKSAAKPSPT